MSAYSDEEEHRTFSSSESDAPSLEYGDRRGEPVVVEEEEDVFEGSSHDEGSVADSQDARALETQLKQRPISSVFEPNGPLSFAQDDDYSSDESCGGGLTDSPRARRKGEQGTAAKGSRVAAGLEQASIVYVHQHGLGEQNNDQRPVDLDANSRSAIDIKELVRYSPEELLSRAWPLVGDDLRCSSFPPYNPFPDVPHLDVLQPNAELLAQFVRGCAHELASRHRRPTATLLRSLLVRSIVLDEQQLPTLQLATGEPDSLVDPEWETVDISTPNVVPVFDTIEDSPFDWIFAMTLRKEERLHYDVLENLNALMDRRGLSTSPTDLIRSWGGQNLFAYVLSWVAKDTDENNTIWLSSGIAFLFKFALALRNTDMLLSVLYVLLLKASRLLPIRVERLGPWRNAIREGLPNRVRLPVPQSLHKPNQYSLFHAFPESVRSKLAACGLCATDEDAIFIFSTSGSFKLSTRPPFAILVQNEQFVVTNCCGTIVEDSGATIAVCQRDGHVLRCKTSDLSLIEEKENSISFNFRKAYFQVDPSRQQHLSLDNPSVIAGLVGPPTRECPLPGDSLSVQFFLNTPSRGCHLSAERSMTILRICGSDGKIWLSIVVKQSASRVVIQFSNSGQEILIQDTPEDCWTHWGATLLATNGLSTWTVFRNGIPWETSRVGGTASRANAPILIEMLNGSLCAHVAGLQVWCKALPLTLLQNAATFAWSGSVLQHPWYESLLLEFPMNEGCGMCLIDRRGGREWRSSSSLKWVTVRTQKPASLFERDPKPHRLEYTVPQGAIFLYNGFETAIVENQLCTWVSSDGIILEQQMLNYSSADPMFYCSATSRFYTINPESLLVRWIQASAPPANHLATLPSFNYSASEELTAGSFAAFIASRMNRSLLIHYFHRSTSTAAELQSAQSQLLGSTNTMSVKTTARLLDVMTVGTKLFAQKINQSELAIIICSIARMLSRQLHSLERSCPASIVQGIVAAASTLTDLELKSDTVEAEMREALQALRELALSRCISHAHQLKIILEAENLADVVNLLAAEHISSLIAALIRQNMTKELNQFVARLADATVSQIQFSQDEKPRRAGAFDAALALFLVLQSLLSHKDAVEWHVTALAIVERIATTVAHALPNADSTVLQNSALGSVVFPIAHLLPDLKPAGTHALKIIKHINGVRRAIVPLLPPPTTETRWLEFSEVKTVVTPSTLPVPFETTMHLPYATSVRIEAQFVATRQEEQPTITISVLQEDFTRKVEQLNEVLQFELGGSFTITASPKSTRCKGASITVEVKAGLETQPSHWLRDLYQALCDATLELSQQMILSGADSQRASYSTTSFLRGGLSNPALSEAQLPLSAFDSQLSSRERDAFLALCNSGDEHDAANMLLPGWKGAYATLHGISPDVKSKLEEIARPLAAALAWHIKSRGTVEEAVRAALAIIKHNISTIREAVQQRRTASIVERCVFMIRNISPRLQVEALIAESVATEEPFLRANSGIAVARSQSSLIPESPSQTMLSSGKSIVRNSNSTMDLAAPSLGHTMTVRGAKKIFRSVEVKQRFTEVSEVVSKELFNFLVDGPSGDALKAIVSSLTDRVKQAAQHVTAYRLQRELCNHKSQNFDSQLVRSILSSTLKYRDQLTLQRTKKSTGSGLGTVDSGRSSEEHYLSTLIGCGYELEAQLQEAYCEFTLSILSNLTSESYSLATAADCGKATEIVQTCALLCHPWEGLDMAYLEPREIFKFLDRIIDVHVAPAGTAAAPASDLSTGFLDLTDRFLISPNSLSASGVEGVTVVEDESIGVQIEGVNAYLTAQNAWQATGGQTTLYFEVTFDLNLSEKLDAVVGLSDGPVSHSDKSDKPTGGENGIVFESTSGLVRTGSKTVSFGSEWNVGDTIGCGMLFPERNVFFTRNGELLGVFGIASPSTNYPLFGVAAKNSLAKAVVNFGLRKPFKFNFTRLHSSCRKRVITPQMLSDSAFLVVNYFVIACNDNLMRSGGFESSNATMESVSGQLEVASNFMHGAVTRLVRCLSTSQSNSSNVSAPVVVSARRLLLGLFKVVEAIILSFRYQVTTSATHTWILRVILLAMLEAKDSSVHIRAIRCFTSVLHTLRPDQMLAAAKQIRRQVDDEKILEILIQLARMYPPGQALTTKQLYVPSWDNSVDLTVRGKGTFFGKDPIPATGTTRFGVKLRRTSQRQGKGAPLGGCYYVGVSAGRHQISTMSNLLQKPEMFILQDTDDSDQVPHLLLRRGNIARNQHRRIYGNDETVWIDVDMNRREISFFRDNNVLIGTAFKEIPAVENLFPVVFLYNEDASCDIFPQSSSQNSSMVSPDSVLHSLAVSSIQHMHNSPVYAPLVKEFTERALMELDNSIDDCLVALAVLGGSLNYSLCDLEGYGIVVVDSFIPSTNSCKVHLESDEDRALFDAAADRLRPLFTAPRIAETGAIDEVSSSVQLLTRRLKDLVFAASFLAPLEEKEQRARSVVELAYDDEWSVLASDVVRLLELLHTATTGEISGPASQALTSVPPTAIDIRFLPPFVFSPNPSIAVTPQVVPTSVTVQCHKIDGPNPSFSVLIAGPQAVAGGRCNAYVGFISGSYVSHSMPVDDIVSYPNVWALSDYDSQGTNSSHCCVQPGLISNSQQLFTTGDVMTATFDRSRQSISFSRTRKGKSTDFGVLFDDVPSDSQVHPFVTIGGDSVAIFLFSDNSTFPPRNALHPIVPISQPRFKACSWCEGSSANNTTWYRSAEREISLCRHCFVSWAFTKQLFFEVVESSPQQPLFVSPHPPKQLFEGAYVEVEEHSANWWNPQGSANFEFHGVSAIAANAQAMLSTLALPTVGESRVDFKITNLVSSQGKPLTGTRFSPLWKAASQASETVEVPSSHLVVSDTTISNIDCAFFSVSFHFSGRPQQVINVGITAMSSCKSMVRADVQKFQGGLLHGIWTDQKGLNFRPDSTSRLYFLVDGVSGTVMCQTSLALLHTKPHLVATNISFEQPQRIFVYATDSCKATLHEGIISCPRVLNAAGAANEAFAVGIALHGSPITEINNSVSSQLFFFDQPGLNGCWTLASDVNEDRPTFVSGSTVTVVVNHSRATIQIYRDCLILGTAALPPTLRDQRLRVVMAPPMIGTCVKFCCAPYSDVRIAKISKVYSDNICCVEFSDGQRKFVCRTDVRFCAAQPATIAPGTPGVFRPDGHNVPKRITIVASTGQTATISNAGERTTSEVPMQSVFSTENEDIAPPLQRPMQLLMMSSSSTKARTFEVGATKYRQANSASYNGIMFDCSTKEAIELTGISVKTHTNGSNRVDVYFKKDSHRNCEREEGRWTKVFSRSVDMRNGSFFSVEFPGVLINANETFALYVNTSHNCGVGFYTDEDECRGEVGTIMDSDGTISVMMGRKSESNTPFADVPQSARGFFGSLRYNAHTGYKPPFIEAVESLCSSPQNLGGDHCERLESKPLKTVLTQQVEFEVEIVGEDYVLFGAYLPVMIWSASSSSTQSDEHDDDIVRAQFHMFARRLDVPREVWVTVCRQEHVLQCSTSEVRLDCHGLPLPAGRHRLLVTVTSSKALKLVANGQPGLVTKKDEAVSVLNFAGALLLAAASTAQVSGRTASNSSGPVKELIAGSTLNQNSSASYNGLMFDMLSKSDIVLDEIFCVSQTTSQNVAVRVFFREGSMEGSERNPEDWTEVAQKTMSLSDLSPFSVGPVKLRMRANQKYSIFVNTSSSCGVRFYNSSDGALGGVGEEYETDGTLTLYVGRKSENSNAFHDIPTEPRAFRGRITYRLLQQKKSDAKQAIFSFPHAYIITRILLSLQNFWSSNLLRSRSDAESDEWTARLVETISHIACGHRQAVVDTDLLEVSIAKGLVRVGRKDWETACISLPTSRPALMNWNRFSAGDVVYVLDSQEMARVHDDADEKQLMLAPINRPAGEAIRTCAPWSLIPLQRCPVCDMNFVTTTICSTTGLAHTLPADAETATELIIRNMVSKRLNVPLEQAGDEAKAIISGSAREEAFSLSPEADGQASPSTERVITHVAPNPGDTLEMEFPIGLLLGDADCIASEFVQLSSARYSLQLVHSRSTQQFSLFLRTDLPLRLPLEDGPAARGPTCFAALVRIVAEDGSVYRRSRSKCATAHRGSCIFPLNMTIAESHCSTIADSTTKRVRILLQIVPAPLPPCPPLLTECGLLKSPTSPWRWSDGSCTLAVAPNQCVFLSDVLRLSDSQPLHHSFASIDVDTAVLIGLGPTPTSPSMALMFKWNSCDILRLLFSVGDGLVILNESNRIVKSIPADSITSLLETGWWLSITNVDTAPCSVTLTSQPTAAGSSRQPIPTWKSFDPLKTTVSAEGRTIACTAGASSQVALGTPLPTHGVSAFAMSIRREDRKQGDALGAGHYAGVALQSFANYSAHFNVVSKEVTKIWAIQDVDDGDSQETQLKIPGLPAATDRLYVSSTVLHFVFDADDGTLLLARDEGPFQKVFHSMPKGMVLCPFVRLDNTAASATFHEPRAPPLKDSEQNHSLPFPVLFPPLDMICVARFVDVCATYPLLANSLSSLPEVWRRRLDNVWRSLTAPKDRFEHAAQRFVVKVLRLGAFSTQGGESDGASPSAAALGEAVNELQNAERHTSVTYSFASAGQTITVDIPYNMDVIGTTTPSTTRLMNFSEKTPQPMTLRLVNLAPDCDLSTDLTLVPHPCVARIHSFLNVSSPASAACAVVLHGFVDITLADIFKSKQPLKPKDRQNIITSILCGLEHYHLHGKVHGHICPENVLVSLDESQGVSCQLWSSKRLEPEGQPYSAPELLQCGKRTGKSDVWSAGIILWQLCNSGFELPFEIDLDDPLLTISLVESLVQESVGLPLEAKDSVVEGCAGLVRCIQSMLFVVAEKRPDVTEILDKSGILDEAAATGTSGEAITFTTGKNLRGGSGSYNGIMFDIVAKRNPVRITKLRFIPDSNSQTMLRLYTKQGTFMGFESNAQAWNRILQKPIKLVDGHEILLDEFPPIEVSPGQHTAIFLHTENSSGVLFYAETDGVDARMGEVQEENADIGITVGKKSESSSPFASIQTPKRFYKGTIIYEIMLPKDKRRTPLFGLSKRTEHPSSTGSGATPGASSPDAQTNTSPLSPAASADFGWGCRVSVSMTSMSPHVEEGWEGYVLRHFDGKLLVHFENGLRLWVPQSKLVVVPDTPAVSFSNCLRFGAFHFYSMHRNFLSPREFPKNHRHVKVQTLSGEGDGSNELDSYFVTETLSTSGLLRVSGSGTWGVAVQQAGNPEVPALEKFDIPFVKISGRPAIVNISFLDRCVYGDSFAHPIAMNITATPLRLILVRINDEGKPLSAAGAVPLADFSETMSPGAVVPLGTECVAWTAVRRRCAAADAVVISPVILDVCCVFVRWAGEGKAEVWAVPVPSFDLRHKRLSIWLSAINTLSPAGDLEPMLLPLHSWDDAEEPAGIMLDLSGLMQPHDMFCVEAGDAAVSFTIRIDDGVRSAAAGQRKDDTAAVAAPTVLTNFFSATSPNVEMRLGGREVVQINLSNEHTTLPIGPFLHDNETHTIELILCGRASVRIVHTSSNWLLLPHMFSTSETAPWSTSYDDCIAPSTSPRATTLALFINMQQRTVKMSINGSLPVDAAPANPSAIPSEAQIELDLSGLGATVQIVSWRIYQHAPPRTSQLWERIIERFGSFPSPHFVADVGTVVRHNAKDAKTSSHFDSPITSMEVLCTAIQNQLVASARDLLGCLASNSRSLPPRVLFHLLSFLRDEQLEDVFKEIAERRDVRRLTELAAEAITEISAPRGFCDSHQLLAATTFLSVALSSNTPLKRHLLSEHVAPSLTLVLLRVATSTCRSTRHAAMRLAQALLSNSRFIVPPAMLAQAMHPLLVMMHGLSIKGKTGAPVVQVGIDMICAIADKYQQAGIETELPGTGSSIAFPLALTVRATVDALHNARPLPLALTHVSEPHRIVMKPVTDATGFRYHFSENFRCGFGCRMFEVRLRKERKGCVAVGWDMTFDPGHGKPSEAGYSALLPVCGVLVDESGNASLCLNRVKEAKPMAVGLQANDVIAIRCHYPDKVSFCIFRPDGEGYTTLGSSDFTPEPFEHITLPHFWASSAEEGDVLVKREDIKTPFPPATTFSMLLDPQGMNVKQGCKLFVEQRGALDESLPAKGYEFYVQLTELCDTSALLRDCRSEVSESSTDESTAMEEPIHMLAQFPLILAELRCRIDLPTVDLRPLLPFVRKMRAFDALACSLFALIVLDKTDTALFGLWSALKPLCGRKAREKVHKDALKNFVGRSGTKASVVIHTMRAQPSLRRGWSATLQASIFGQLYQQLSSSPSQTFFSSPMFTAKLAGFGATDAGGPYREVLSLLAAEIMSTHPSGHFQMNPLFKCVGSSRDVIMPNPAMCSSLSLLMLEFFGKLLAFFTIGADMLAVDFPVLFWKLLLKDTLSHRDLLSLDKNILRNTEPDAIADTPLADFEDEFPGISSAVEARLSQQQQFRATSDKSDNSADTDSAEPLSAAHAACEAARNIMMHRFDEPMSAIRTGFTQIVPMYALHALYWKDIRTKVCGVPTVGRDALREESDTAMLPSHLRDMFWKVVGELTDEERSLLLRFATGQSRLPLRSKLKIQERSGASVDSFPTSSTCFFTLNLPRYSSDRVMRERLLYAVRQCQSIDNDGQATESLSEI